MGTISMSALCARSISLAEASDYFLFWLKPGSDTGFQKGISPSADGDSGLCPENPQPFEKGWRKLYFACGRELVQFIAQALDLVLEFL